MDGNLEKYDTIVCILKSNKNEFYFIISYRDLIKLKLDTWKSLQTTRVSKQRQR
jgi:hypothetical protein